MLGTAAAPQVAQAPKSAQTPFTPQQLQLLAEALQHCTSYLEVWCFQWRARCPLLQLPLDQCQGHRGILPAVVLGLLLAAAHWGSECAASQGLA